MLIVCLAAFPSEWRRELVCTSPADVRVRYPSRERLLTPLVVRGADKQCVEEERQFLKIEREHMTGDVSAPEQIRNSSSLYYLRFYHDIPLHCNSLDSAHSTSDRSSCLGLDLARSDSHLEGHWITILGIWTGGTLPVALYLP